MNEDELNKILELHKKWLDAAEGDEDIKHISRRLQIALDAKRGRATGLGEQGALELLAALGVWLGENGGE